MKNAHKEMGTMAVIVADELGLDAMEMFSMNRKRSLVYGRQIFHYMCKRYLNETLEFIGKFSKVMGRPKEHDHATVLHGYRAVKDLISVDKVYLRKVEAIENRIQEEVINAKEKEKPARRLKHSIVEEIFAEENMEFLSKLKDLVSKLSRNKNIDELNEILKYQEEINNGRVREASQSYSSMGVVQGSEY